MRIRLSSKKLLVLACCGTLAAGAFSYGFVLGHTKIPPYPMISQLFRSVTADFTGHTTTSTTLLQLELRSVGAPAGSPLQSHRGGGITSFDEAVLGIERDGKAFLYLSSGEMVELMLNIATNVAALIEHTSKHYRLGGTRPKTDAIWETSSHAENPEAFALRYFGFLDVAASKANGTLHMYVAYNYWHPDRSCKTVRVSRYLTEDLSDLRSGELAISESDWVLVFESQPCVAFEYRDDSPFQSPNIGGHLTFDASGGLVLALGDHDIGEANTGGIAARYDYIDYGKIIRIDPATLSSVHIASGIRDPKALWALSDGSMLLSDMGPTDSDDLHLIGDRHNHEWACANSSDDRSSLSAPLYSWSPSIHVSGILQIADIPEVWDGDFLVAASGGELFRLRIEEERVLFVEPIRIAQPIKKVIQSQEGTILLWTGDRNFIEVRPVVAGGLPPSSRKAFTEKQRSLGLDRVIASCAECHSFEDGLESATAPPLWGVLGRRIAAAEYDFYSAALLNVKGVWTEHALKEYLGNPQEFAPGSTMPPQTIGSDETLDALIDYLRQLR